MNLMLTVAIYLASRFTQCVFEFLEHWYWGSFRVAGDKFIDLLKRWDRFFALRITLRHWREPLYQDRTFIGYILGPIFRTGRIAIALAVYLTAAALAGLLYLFWLLIPLYIVYRIAAGIFNL